MAQHHVDISTDLVRELLKEQFPAWSGLPLRPVEPGGWDNRTFRLGEQLSVRLPSAAGYAAQVDKEQRWLPWLAPRLPLPIPTPLARGRPSPRFPWPWSVYRWLEGEPVNSSAIADLPRFARDLASLLAALQSLDPTGGPPAGPHNCYRGAPLTVYDAETRQALATLRDELDVPAARHVWEAALNAPWSGPPVWIHGDVAPGNLLVQGGQLSAVIDFGCLGVGDPACDTVIAWTLFAGTSRAAFRAALPLDAATWARGRGWALWKVLITLAKHREGERAEEARHVLREVLADHQQGP